MEGPGLDSGGGRPAWFSLVFLGVRDREARGPRLGAASTTRLLWATRRGGERFLAAVAGCMGISEGSDGGDFPRAVRPECLARRERGYSGRGPLQGTCRLVIWTSHRLMGLREGIAGALDRGDGVGRLSRGPARGPLGWAETLSPLVGRVGFPGFWFLLEIVRVVFERWGE